MSGVTNSAFSTYLSSRWLSSFILCTRCWMTVLVYFTGIQFNWQWKTKLNQRSKQEDPSINKNCTRVAMHASKHRQKLSFDEKFNRSTCRCPRSGPGQRQETLNSFLRSANTFCLTSGHRTRLLICQNQKPFAPMGEKSQSELAWLFSAFVP